MKSKYIPTLIMSVIYKNHEKINGEPCFITKDNLDYTTCYEDTRLITLTELRETLEDIFGSDKDD